MTNIEQDFVIAQHVLNIEHAKCPCGCGADGWWSKTISTWLSSVPNYDDLNEINKAEEALTYEQRAVYAARLHPKEVLHHTQADFVVLHSGPKKRREEYVRTIGKWKD